VELFRRGGRGTFWKIPKNCPDSSKGASQKGVVWIAIESFGGGEIDPPTAEGRNQPRRIPFRISYRPLLGEGVASEYQPGREEL